MLRRGKGTPQPSVFFACLVLGVFFACLLLGGSAGFPCRPCPAQVDDGPPLPEIPALALMAHAGFLAGEELEGRAAGSAGERIAAAYLSARLDATAVGAPPERGRRQEFSLSGAPGKEPARSLNVLGWIEGSKEDLKGEVIVLGAHMDHLGRTPAGLHPGAEDNASGLAVVLETGAALQASRASLGRSVLVAFFGGEERGLLGSRRFVKEPPVALDRVAAMVNVDMIGRPLADQLALAPLKKLLKIDDRNAIGVVGAKDNPLFRTAVDRACSRARIQVFGTRNIPFVSNVIEGMARSRGDDTPFAEVGVPTLFFGSGESDDYHKPADTARKLVPELMARRAQAIYATIVSLSNAPREKLRRPPQ